MHDTYTQSEQKSSHWYSTATILNQVLVQMNPPLFPIKWWQSHCPQCPNAWLPPINISPSRTLYWGIVAHYISHCILLNHINSMNIHHQTSKNNQVIIYHWPSYLTRVDKGWSIRLKNIVHKQQLIQPKNLVSIGAVHLKIYKNITKQWMVQDFCFQAHIGATTIQQIIQGDYSNNQLDRTRD